MGFDVPVARARFSNLAARDCPVPAAGLVDPVVDGRTGIARMPQLRHTTQTCHSLAKSEKLFNHNDNTNNSSRENVAGKCGSNTAGYSRCFHKLLLVPEVAPIYPSLLPASLMPLKLADKGTPRVG